MKRIIIIGGGISGIISGIYAKLHNYEVIIYEKNAYMGGLLNDYSLIDNGMYYPFLEGVFKDIGISINTYINNNDTLVKYKDICITRDIDKLKNDLVKLSRVDETNIKKMIDDITLAKSLYYNTDNSRESLGFFGLVKNQFLSKVNNKIYNKYYPCYNA